MKDVRSRKCCIYDNWPFFFSEKVCSRISKLLTGLNREKLRLNYLLISLPIVLFLEKKVKDILKGIKCVSENKTKVSKTRKIPEFLLNESIESGLGWIGNSLNSSIKISWNSSLIIYFFIFFWITRNALISLALKVHSQNIYFTHGLMKLSTERCASPSRVRRAA